jgi:cobyrinic acid a,c-diamide synthase
MAIETPRVVIAAPSSGSGKSTIATGLMAALAKRHSVQGYKVGPDYIDPGYHTLACGRVSRNLDTWMVPAEEVVRTFARAAREAEVAVIEGVMGLYDGFEGKSESGSTAEVAKLLGAPVVLVIDVARMARSAGALALGYREFDPDLNLAGVICNNAGGEKHALWVTQAVESTGLPVLGCLPRTSALAIPERHLGLHTAIERTSQVEAFLEGAAMLVSEHIDLGRLWEIARSGAVLEIPPETMGARGEQTIRIGVARDEAFCFYYEDNFDWLRAAGVELVSFSPIHDRALPKRIAGLYLGGGYPELYADQLAANRPMKEALRSVIMGGMPTYAECGGLMYLTESITDLDGRTHPMLGLVPGRAHMADRLTMGYRQVTAARDSILFAAGERLRGHEFHYSEWLERPEELPHAYAVSPRMSEQTREEGFAHDNIVASYIHLHFGQDPRLAERFVEACQEWQEHRSAVRAPSTPPNEEG